MARATDGLTGSEIENVFVDAMFIVFESDNEPTDLTIAQVLNEFVPLSKLMAEQITGLRTWVKGRARSATSPQPQEERRPGRLLRDWEKEFAIVGGLFFTRGSILE